MNAAEELIEAYESIRARLPQARFCDHWRRLDSLEAVIDVYDVFLFDAFGVLNVGDTAIPGAARRIEALRAAGKRVMVVSNAASVPASALGDKYRRLGFDFRTDEIVSSRDALCAALRGADRDPLEVGWDRGGAGGPAVAGAMLAAPPGGAGFCWGAMAMAEADLSDLPVAVTPLGDDETGYVRSDGFILLSAADWSEARQARLTRALRQRPRPVLVANPDLVAPREHGWSLEPGHFARRLERDTGIRCDYFGKPFANIFSIALRRLGAGVDYSRVLMVGDTLHTDVLGGRAAGLGTALATDHGVSRGLDLEAVSARIGIRPDFVVRGI